MDKSCTENEDQGDWSDYELSEGISVPILPRKRKCAFHVQFFITKSYRKGVKQYFNQV